MPYCVVPGCTNGDGSGVSMHTFPRDVKQKKQWLHAIKRKENWKPTTLSVVCGAHFLPEQFVVNPEVLASLGLPPPRRHQLKRDAIPEVFQFKATSTGPKPRSLIQKKARKEVGIYVLLIGKV